MSYIVTAEKIVCGGDCLAHLNGKNIFIPYAIPGEKLEIVIEKETRDYATGKIIKILEPSKHRVEPFCPYYQKCGGCNMQHISFEHQRTLRIEILKDCFLREGIKINEIIPIYANEKKYRCRIQLTNGGFNEKSSNNIIPIGYCPILTEELNSYLKTTPFFARPKGRIHLFADSRIEGSNKIFVANDTTCQNNEQKLLKRNGKPIKNKVKQRFQGTSYDAINSCTVNLLGKKINFNVRGFFQSNLEVLEKTIELVSNNLKGENLLDMYCGAGTFSVFLADKFKKLTLVEHNRDALVYAEMNLQGFTHESYGLSGAKWTVQNAPTILSKQGKFDAVVIDPPRSGIEKEVSAWLCQNKAFQLRSISCDPATHARDSAKFIKNGYNLKKLYLLDFYPQTSHVESLAYFENEN